MSSTSAAFFDLDRTLLAGASGEVYSQVMRDLGLSQRQIPGEKLLFRAFNAIGETLPTMLLTRQGIRLARGRSQAEMRAAALHAAPLVAELIQPLAGALFDEHRQAGRRLVLATTTPFDLVEPLADVLGLDDVVATRFVVDATGRYTGDLSGPFVWSAGKRDAVRTWAAEHDIDLEDSYAYSDSIYDTPLLGSVGHPVVVNPDPRMRVMAMARRWPSISLAEPSAGLRIPIIGTDVAQLAMDLTSPMMFPYARFDIAGVENIPTDGPAIIVGNHRSYFDSAAMVVTIAKSKRTARFLGKKEVFDVPIVGPLIERLGGIRVDRGTGSDAPLAAAVEALERGEIVGLMPQGTIPRGPAFFEPELKGRWGAARLAAETRAPVIPVGIWGTEKVWPRSSRLPAMFRVIDPPLVRVRVGAPVDLKYRSADADTKRIMAALVDLLPAEARQPYTPTAEELAKTYPPGYHGDPNHESDRRPGTD